MKNAAKVPVSAYMLTFNNARTVEKALQSLSWVDEIVVVDSFSTDATLDLVRKYTTNVQQRKWPGFRDQYQYAADQCSHDWVVFIDADEEISPELATEMQQELQRNAAAPETERIQGYHGHRRTYYLGKWIIHGGWVPDHEIRLYNRISGCWKGDLHANVHVDGPVEHLKHFYYHYTYADIADQLQTINKYSSMAAADMQENGKCFSWLHFLGNPLARFCRDFFFKRGFLDGMPGLIVAVNTMFYVFAKHAKLWEAQRQTQAPGDGIVKK